jgi:hypothetical protein
MEALPAANRVRANLVGDLKEKDNNMWEVVGIVAAVVVIILLFQILDVTDSLADRLRGRAPRKDIEERVARLEKRLDDIERNR